MDKIFHVVTFVIKWDEMFLIQSICHHMDSMLSCGVNVIIWGQMLSCGRNVIMWDEMSSCEMNYFHVGRNIIMWVEMLSYGHNVIM